MKIFCDTNIILEFIQHRKDADIVEYIISSALDRQDELYISVGSFYTITYLIERYLKQDTDFDHISRIREQREILNGILSTFSLAILQKNSLQNAVNDSRFKDLEDSYQAKAAEDAGCNVILTINSKHFCDYDSTSSIEVLTPKAFVDKYIPNA